MCTVNRLRRLIAAALAIVMAMSLSVSAFAAETSAVCSSPGYLVCTSFSNTVADILSFSDVPDNHTFHDSILWCASLSIVGGYTDGSFRPANTVTQSNFTVMLSRAFYASDITKYSTDSVKSLGSFYPNYLALKNNGIWNNVSFDTDDVYNPSLAASMNRGISRYDMAQLMTNIMAANGFSASSNDKNNAIAKITDYNHIPSQYRDAVTNVYALGIISGYSDGSFAGDATMNRGQAAVVIYRMTLKMSSSGENPTPDPEVPAPKPTTVAVTQEAPDKYGLIAWTIADNGYSTGRLNNGKPITQENVLELLAEAKKIWPDGLSWNYTGKDTNIYNSGKGETIAYKAILAHRTNPAQACGGFAAMLSDYIFGASSNPVRRLTDNTQVRPGDIVFRINPDGSVAHVNIALTTVGRTNGGNPGIKTADGNVGGVIEWTDTASNYPTRIDDYQRAAGMSTCIIYTRYPA
ncbi:MAG: S-layer homology domain-containing protein [Oscillibacter sp.]|nr:S-layer homology domain-containing protein [Oscillibacter sp.]